MTEKDIIHKLTYLLHGHRRKIFIIFGCLLISTGLNLCIPFISKEIMDEGFIGGNKNILLYLVVGSFAIYMLISAFVSSTHEVISKFESYLKLLNIWTNPRYAYNGYIKVM